jgi:hypothetical protein
VKYVVDTTNANASIGPQPEPPLDQAAGAPADIDEKYFEILRMLVLAGRLRRSHISRSMLRLLIANGDAVVNQDKWLVITEAGKSRLYEVTMQIFVRAHAWVKTQNVDALVKKMVKKSRF